MFEISLSRKHQKLCNGMSRRDVLRLGALAPLGLSLPALLQAEAAAGETAHKARAKSVILVYLGGGLSHHDSFDLKPDAPEEIRGKYKPIDSSVPGTQVGELLPKMAQCMDKICLLRSGAHNNDHHETATNWVLSGRFGSAFGDFPAMGAVAAHEIGFHGTLPPYVSIPRNPSFTWELGKSAYLGGRYESFKTGDPNQENFKVRDVGMEQPLLKERVARREKLLATVDRLAKRVQGNDQLNTYDEFHERAAAMILTKEARDAFDIDREEARLRDRYGRNTFGQSLLLARRLVERGVRFATINYGGWDHHEQIWKGLEKKLPEFDQGMSAFVEDMHQAGLFKDTLVVVMGEFGRTPKVNEKSGRDHWGRAASLLFAGAGVQPGKVVGATDKEGAFVTTRPVEPADVAYTVLSSLGIDPHKFLPSPDGRPIEILDRGELITELFS